MWVLAAMVCVFAGPGVAWAATSASAEGGSDGSFISYVGTAEATTVGPDGETEPDISDQVTITISCTGDDCWVTGFPQQSDDFLPIEGASGVWDLPAKGNVCDPSTYRYARTYTLAATATSLTASMHQPGVGWYSCPDNPATESYTWGMDYAIVAEFREGSACVLEGRSCAVDSGSDPGQVPAADPIAGDEPGAPASGEPRTLASPSVLGALAVPSETLSLEQCVLAAALAVVLALLVGFPTQLLSSVSQHVGDRIAAWWRRTRPQRTRPRRPSPELSDAAAVTSVRAWGPAAAGVLGAAVIAGFVDPSFGFDLASLRQFASILIGFALDVVLGWFVLTWLVGALHPDASTRIEFGTAEGLGDS